MSLKRFRGPNSKNTNTNPNASAGEQGPASSSGRILYEVVVTNFFSNPEFDLKQDAPDDSGKTLRESMQSGKNKVKNSNLVGKMPRCSISGVVVSDRGAWSNPKPEIFYPLFPHLTLPVKPGEKVWVIYDTGSRDSAQRGYWLGRISSNINVDDPNYTHLDREFLYSKVGVSSDSSMAAATGDTGFEDTDVYSFLAGAGNSNNNTMPGQAPYDSICENSPSYINQFNGEPVPRFSPRVGDLVLEGSNNTLIALGQDRASTTGPEDDSDIKGIGTIDIVVGRGQGAETAPAGDPIELEKRGQSLTGYSETNKYPQFQGDEPNELEGNPDFATDLSRVYVSMKTNGDENFGLVFTNDSVPQVAEAPYIINKSTEIRLISRDGGSIRMLKEGSSQAEICISSSGTIIIEGTHSGRESQKVIRGEDLVKALKEFSEALDTALSPTPGVAQTLGNMGGPIVDGDGVGTGVRAAAKKLAAAAEIALSGEVYIK